MDDFDTPPDAAHRCPRHPDRVSYRRCETCGHPTCPDCVAGGSGAFECIGCAGRVAFPPGGPGLPVDGGHSAVSGHSPVDPTARHHDRVPDGTSARQWSEPAGSASWMTHEAWPVAPSATTADVHAGAGAVPAAVGPRPIVTYVVAGLCVLVYAAQRLMPGVTLLGDYSPLAGYLQPWRFLTAAFLHSPETVTHLVFNLMGLYTMGQFLEPFLGRARFTALYLLSALGGSVGCLVAVPRLDPHAQASVLAWTQAMVGASGAVFGLFAAAFLVLRRTGMPVAGMVVLLAINLALPLFTPGIAWQAHVGGALVGALVTLVMLGTASRGGRVLWPALAGVLLALVGVVLVVYRVNADALALVRPFLAVG